MNWHRSFVVGHLRGQLLPERCVTLLPTASGRAVRVQVACAGGAVPASGSVEMDDIGWVTPDTLVLCAPLSQLADAVTCRPLAPLPPAAIACGEPSPGRSMDPEWAYMQQLLQHALAPAPLSAGSIGSAAARTVLLRGPPGCRKSVRCVQFALRTDTATQVMRFRACDALQASTPHRPVESLLGAAMHAAWQRARFAPVLLLVEQLEALAGSTGAAAEAMWADDSEGAEGGGDVGAGGAARGVVQLVSAAGARRGLHAGVRLAVVAVAAIDMVLPRVVADAFDETVVVGLPDAGARACALRRCASAAGRTVDDDAARTAALELQGCCEEDLEAVVATCVRSEPASAQLSCAALAAGARDVLGWSARRFGRVWTVTAPRVRWSDVGGLLDVKQSLREMLVWPVLHAQVHAECLGNARAHACTSRRSRCRRPLRRWECNRRAACSCTGPRALARPCWRRQQQRSCSVRSSRPPCPTWCRAKWAAAKRPWRRCLKQPSRTGGMPRRVAARTMLPLCATLFCAAHPTWQPVRAVLGRVSGNVWCAR